MKKTISVLAVAAMCFVSCTQDSYTEDVCVSTNSTAATRSFDPVASSFSDPSLYALNCEVESLATAYMQDSQQRSIWGIFRRIFCVVYSDALGALVGSTPIGSVFFGITFSAVAAESTTGMQNNNMQSGGTINYVNDSSMVFNRLVLNSSNLTLSDSVGQHHNVSLYKMYKQNGERPSGTNMSSFVQDCLLVAARETGLSSSTIDVDSLEDYCSWLELTLRANPTAAEMSAELAEQFPDLEDELTVVSTVVENCLSIQASQRRQYVKQCIVSLNAQISDADVRQRLNKSFQTIYASSMLWNFQSMNNVIM